MKFLFIILIFALSETVLGQAVTRDIKSFGAKGDGKTNDHEAFKKAAEFFNSRGGNGKLIIPEGVYIIGKQKFNKNTTTVQVYEPSDALAFLNVKDFGVEGVKGSILKFTDSLRFGAFDPKTGLPHKHGTKEFYKYSYIGGIGNAVSFTGSSNVYVKNLELNGNSNSHILGGTWGDVGTQLPHSGILITNSTSVTINNIYAHHFGLDGIIVSNNTGNAKTPDKIVIEKSSFEYNGRQGLSWVGGNDLSAINCKFNHTGRGKITSPPGAGVDIEAEVGPVTNGKFVDCEFVNNAGCGMVADQGPSSNCTFINCTFWGVTAWSIWVAKPGFKFLNCKIYGSIVHGFDANNELEATKYIGCLFEDRPYNGQEPYGKFLVETNFKRRVTFENCTMIAHKKKLLWMETYASLPAEEKYQVKNCKFYLKGNLIPVEKLKTPFVNFQ